MSKLIRSLGLISCLAGAVWAGPAAAGAMDDATAIIAPHKVMPAFTAPGAPFDAKACMAGKKVFEIPLTMTNPFNVQVSKAMAERQ